MRSGGEPLAETLMSQFNDHGSDNPDPRRSLGLSDLPALRDARGETVAPDDRPDNQPPNPGPPVGASENSAGTVPGSLPIVGPDPIGSQAPTAPTVLSFGAPVPADAEVDAPVAASPEPVEATTVEPPVAAPGPVSTSPPDRSLPLTGIPAVNQIEAKPVTDVAPPTQIAFGSPAPEASVPASTPAPVESAETQIVEPKPSAATDMPNINETPAAPEARQAPATPIAPSTPPPTFAAPAATRPLAWEPPSLDAQPVASEPVPDAPAPVSAPELRTFTAVAPADGAEPVTATNTNSIDTALLRALVTQAENAAERLENHVSESKKVAQEPNELSTDLQDRLRVGARMLKAFQTQIDRAEAAIREANDRTASLEAVDAMKTEAITALEAAKAEAANAIAEAKAEAAGMFDSAGKAEVARIRKDLAGTIDTAREAIDERARRRARPAVEVKEIVDQIEAHVADRLKQVDTHIESNVPHIPSQDAIDLRVEQALQAAVERFDRHAQQSRSDLAGQVDQTRELQARVLELAEHVDTAESQVQRLVANADESARAIRSETDEARTIARQAQDARAAVNADLRRAAASIEEFNSKGERVRMDVDEQIARFERLREHVSASFGGIDAAVRKVERVESTVDRLERLAEQLAPWEDLLINAPQTADGLPRPAVEMVRHMQEAIGQDMQTISASMQEMASRMSELGGGSTPVAKPSRAGKKTGNKTGKPASTAEARPGGYDQPIPNRPERSNVLSALEEERRPGDAAESKVSESTDDAPRLKLRKTGTSS